MNRCDICNATEFHDELADLGLEDPITHFVVVAVGNQRECRCNRCNEAIREVNRQFQEDDYDRR